MSHTPHRQRLRGRLGIDVASQSPTPVVLPPLLHASPRRVGLRPQQHEELTQLVHDFRQRLETTRAMGLDLTTLQEAVALALERPNESHAAEDDDADADCFSSAKRVLASVETAPFLSQFLREIVLKIETFVHEKRQHEALVLAGLPRSQVGVPESSDTVDDTSDASSISSFEFSDESSDDDADAEAHGEEPSQEETQEQDLRHVPTRAVFRTTLRSRKFPPTHIPTTEFVHKTSAYMPFDLLKRSPDIASLRLQGHNELGSAQWRMLLFPKKKPSWSDQEELAAFTQWAKTKLEDHQQPQQSTLPASIKDAETLAVTRVQFKDALAVKELVCYELCRFVFDKCPTTARFLHGLFLELVDLTLRALAAAEREQQIMEQRHKNVQLELTRLHEKLLKVQKSFATLEETLATRQERLLRERELIIRKRKKLNLLLSADQVLIRRLMGLIYHAQELADDVLTESYSHNLVVSNNTAPPAQPGERLADASRFSGVDEVVALVVDKYGELPQFHQTRVKEATQRASLPSSSVGSSESHDPTAATESEIIVLDANDIKSAMEVYRATLMRLSRVLSAKSPDSSTGWNAQELWDQALFIPPHEEVQDLESDVQRLCLLVEERIVTQRHRRAMAASVRTIAVQTDISACLPRNGRPQPQLDQQRWRARPFAHDPPPPPTPKAPAVPTWNWRRHSKRDRRQPRSNHSVEQRAELSGGEHTAPSTAPKPTTKTTIEEDHANLRATIVPQGFRAFIRAIPPDYVSHQLSLHHVHSVITYLFNGVWMLVQEDFHRPPRFSTVTTTNEARLIPLTTIHEYIYRIHLQHFHVECVVTSRLLDLLVSASRLDTQSCKIQLFCRLLGMPGVTPFPSDGFWFVLKALHVLQRCCGSTGGYFLLDAEGDNEFVPQASAAEALSQLFAGSSNEVLKRLRLKLSGLASVYGTVWIPAYNILIFIMDEWQAGQDALRLLVEEKLFVEHASETDPFTGLRIFTNENNVVTFSEFLHGFVILQLHVNRSEALQAYRQLLLDSTLTPTTNSTSSSPPTRIDRHRFYVNWMQMILHAVNVSQQQMLRPQNAPPASTFLGGLSNNSSSSGGGNAGPGVQLGAIADAMVAAHQQLAHKFLLISWEQMKPEVIRRLDAKFNDVGQQMRLVQQMDAVIARHSHQTLQRQQSDGNSAWRSFHQLIQIAYTHSSS